MTDYVKKKDDGSIVYSPAYMRDLYNKREKDRKTSGKFFGAAGLGAAAGGVLTGHKGLMIGGLAATALIGLDRGISHLQNKYIQKGIAKKEGKGESIVYRKDRPGIFKSKWEKTSSDMLGQDAYVTKKQYELDNAWSHIRKGKSELKRLREKYKKDKPQEKKAGVLKAVKSLQIMNLPKRMPKTISNKVRRRGMTPEVQTYLKGGKKLPTDITQKDSDALFTAFSGSRSGSTEEILARKGIASTWGPAWGRRKSKATFPGDKK